MLLCILFGWTCVNIVCLWYSTLLGGIVNTLHLSVFFDVDVKRRRYEAVCFDLHSSRWLLKKVEYLMITWSTNTISHVLYKDTPSFLSTQKVPPPTPSNSIYEYVCKFSIGLVLNYNLRNTCKFHSRKRKLFVIFKCLLVFNINAWPTIWNE